ncbi:MAG: hypothetical protein AB1782_00760 [Cyanobacteriota bacterium]
MSLTLQANNLYMQQKQLQLAKQMEKFQNSLAEYNLQKVVRFYTDAINSAESSNDARYLAESLNSILSTYGKSIGDIDGINNPLLNDPAAGAAGKAGKKQRGNPMDKAVIKDLKEEMGLKSSKDKDWLELAKKDDRVRILDKEGNDVTDKLNADNMKQMKNGDPKLQGYVLEVKSEKHGLVKIAVGGDGNINGGDDKVIAMGNKVAAEGIFHGMNQVSNLQGNGLNSLTGGNNLLAGLSPEDLDLLGIDKSKGQLFTETEIKNLLAAILNDALTSIEKEEYNKKINSMAV